MSENNKETKEKILRDKMEIIIKNLKNEIKMCKETKIYN